MALAIELAAARWPTLGLDGLTAGLSDQLRILAGGLPRRRPAPVGAGGAGLEPRPAGAGGSGNAAAGVGVRRAVHRRVGRGGGRVRPTGAGRGRRRAGPPRRAEPARGDDFRGWHPVPGAGDHPPVRDRAAHRGRRAGRRARPAPGLVPGPRVRPHWRRTRGLARPVRRGRRRPPGRPDLGGRPPGSARGRVPPRLVHGRADLHAQPARRGPAAVRAGGRARRRPRRRGRGAPARRRGGRVPDARRRHVPPARCRRGGRPPGGGHRRRRPRLGDGRHHRVPVLRHVRAAPVEGRRDRPTGRGAGVGRRRPGRPGRGGGGRGRGARGRVRRDPDQPGQRRAEDARERPPRGRPRRAYRRPAGA